MKVVYAGLLTVVMMLPVAVFAKTDSAKVNFDHALMVAGQKVPAGHYDVRWSGNGPAVQTKFVKDGKTVATASAKIVDQKNPYNNAFETSKENGSRVLTAIDRSNFSLKFPQNGKTKTSMQ
ncbi:MAG: hypothetical protein ROO76_16035 [Terriglobia bacterium]|nr:hypothetical protein [Terriglobia bacterium]